MPSGKETPKRLELSAPVEEGPYYKDGSPERQTIAGEGITGTKLVLEGRVLDVNGNPVTHAWLDFWNADGRGKYDNKGFNLRGHQYTDAAGRYRLETIRPHWYLFRAPHIHVKVRANDNAPVYTAQLYFHGEARNLTDPIFEKKTVLEIKDTPDGQLARFDFVVET